MTQSNTEQASPAPVPAPSKPGRLGPDGLDSLLLGLLFLLIYNSNADFLPTTDATANTYLPLNILKGHGFSYKYSSYPFMFIKSNDKDTDGRPLPPAPANFLVPSIRQDPATHERLYVNAFGVGPGLCALPVIAPLAVMVGDLEKRPEMLWLAAKFSASLLAAASGALVFLIARVFLERGQAMLVASSYGLGTCVWSTSSQALWQHGASEFFLMLGTLWFLKRSRSDWYATAAGAALGFAVVCRPTSVMLAGAIAVCLLLESRRSFLAFCLGGLPLAIGLGAYNFYYLGSPFASGQLQAARHIALLKTGSDDLWQTPLWLGAAGQLFSPSRGLFVFSPFLLAALGGAVLTWRRREFRDLRPITVAVALMLLLEFKYFDWWSGWSYAYRRIADPAALLTLLLIPVIPWILAQRYRLAVYLILLAWSIAVQFLGAFAFDVFGWNSLWDAFVMSVPGESGRVLIKDPAGAINLVLQKDARIISEVRFDVDDPRYRHRLWSLTDSQIGYCLAHFGEARARKHLVMKEFLGSPMRVTYLSKTPPTDSPPQPAEK